MLVEDGIAAKGRVEEVQTGRPLGDEHEEGDANGLGSGGLDNGGCQGSPGEDRHTEKAHAGGTHGGDGNDQVDRTGDGGETVDVEA
jgi:hypothetical protein